MKQTSLLGTWKKISSAACDQAYPDEIEFFEATYIGRKGQSGQRFIVWDAGTYHISAPDQVTISTATDEQIVYRFSLSGATLKFVDSAGCEFEYRRVK